MKFAYCILYVPDVPKALHFYEKAFGFKKKFLHESHEYGECATGETTLAFASESLSALNGLSFIPNRPEAHPAGFELAFVSADLPAAYQQALEAGAESVQPPAPKPWGQLVAYVRDLNGALIELCSPIS